MNRVLTKEERNALKLVISAERKRRLKREYAMFKTEHLVLEDYLRTLARRRDYKSQVVKSILDFPRDFC